MRKSLFAVLAALVVALGLGAGVASASPVRGPHTPPGCTLGSSTTGCTVTFPNGGSRACSASDGVLTSTLCTLDPRTGRPIGGGGLGLGLGLGVGGGYAGFPTGFPGLVNQDLLSLSALGLVGVNADLNVCAFPTFDAFNSYGVRHFGAWGGVQSRWFGNNGAQLFAQLQQQAACQASVNGGVVVNGGAGLLNGNGGLLINGSQGLYLNGQTLNLGQYGLNGLGALNVCQFSNFNQFNSFGSRRFGGAFGGFRSRFGSNPGAVFAQAQQQAACTAAEEQQLQELQLQQSGNVVIAPSSTTTINNPVQPVVEPTVQSTPPSVLPAPAEAPVSPAPSGSTIVEVPSGPIQTGDSGIAPDAVVVR